MKTIHLTSVTLKPKEGVKVELEDGYEKCLVFYPVADSAAPYLNMQFLDAQLGEKSVQCHNTDETFEHELWIVQFNHPLPPIFQIEPWQILTEGKLPVEKKT
ncbi:unnamed protein product [marine sediment metagenome]|uniref:Uncharacterized protein n=1 Tax=marine sediment metagenome TaxID=412755 RepID=X1SII1_9ZZZZ